MKQPDELRSSQWPIVSMLLFGNFGEDASPLSRRAARRSRIAVMVLVAAVLAVGVLPSVELSARRSLVSALVGVTLSYLAWEAWRYTTHLDELTRRLHLEAFAITYLIGLALFAILGALQNMAGVTITPLVFLALEPVRGVVLVCRTRGLA
jgi:hypothetical protein